MTKFSELQNLPVADNDDLIPILDVSESLPQNKNKTITVEDLLANSVASGNPFVVVNTDNGEDPLPAPINYDIGMGVFIGTTEYTTPRNYLYGVYVGNNNLIDSTGISGPGFPSFTSIVGDNNSILGYSKESRILGYSSIIKNSWGGLIVGTNSSIGQAPFDNSTTVDPYDSNNFLYYDNSIAIGDSVKVESFNSIAIGYMSKAFNSNCISLGANAKSGVENTNYNQHNYATALGANCEAAGRYSTAIGSNSETSPNAQAAVAIGGAFVANTAPKSIAIGDYSYTNGPGSISIGANASCNNTAAGAISIGYRAAARSESSLVIGEDSGISNVNNLNNIIIGAFSGTGSDCSNSIAIGTHSDILGPFSNETVLVGTYSQIMNGNSFSILLGANSNIQANAAGSTVIGGSSLITTSNYNSTMIGIYCSIEGATSNGNTIIGNNSHVYANTCNHNILIGTNANIQSSNSNISNSVQLGTGNLTTSNTLQFLTTPIANSTSIQATTQNTGVAPISTPVDGTIIVEQSGTGKLYVRVNGTWKSVALV